VAVLEQLGQVVLSELHITKVLLEILSIYLLLVRFLLVIQLVHLLALLLLLVLLSVAGVDQVLALTFLLFLGLVDDLLVLSLHELLLLLECSHLVSLFLGGGSTITSGVEAREVVVKQDALARLDFTATATNSLLIFGANLLRQGGLTAA